MSNNKTMCVPYYILVNDEDSSKPKFYHEYPYGRTPYESVYQDMTTNTFPTDKGWITIGPRRMRYVETAIRFRNKIAKALGISTTQLKIVRVCETQKETFKNLKEGRLKEISFENVWE